MDLNEKEQHTYETIGKVVNGTMTRKEAMVELHKSRQQIYNLIKVYKSEGKDGFVHKNRGKQSDKKIDRGIIEELEQLYMVDYYDYNFTAFYDELSEKKNTKVNMIFHIQLCIGSFLMMILFPPYLIKKQLNYTMKEWRKQLMVKKKYRKK